MLGLAAALGTALVAIATWVGGFDATGTEDNEVLFFWVALYSFYFFRTWHALLQIAVIAVAYGLLLGANATPEEAPTRFIIVIGTLLVAGLLVARLRTAMESLIDGLERQARRDELTGALNRRGLDERAAELFPGADATQTRATDTAVGFLLIDLDEFTMYNDLQGQQAGDALLRHVASAIRSSVRSEDVVARLGGDEFGVLLAAVDPDERRGGQRRRAHRPARELADGASDDGLDRGELRQRRRSLARRPVALRRPRPRGRPAHGRQPGALRSRSAPHRRRLSAPGRLRSSPGGRAGPERGGCGR